MERILISELGKHVGEKVCVKGFLHELRGQSKVKFVLLRESSGIIQCVALPESKEVFATIEKVPKESVLKIMGILKLEKQAPGGMEIAIEEYEILSKASLELPIQVVEKGGEEISLPLRLDYRWIELRKPKQALIFKIWTTLEEEMRHYCLKKGCMQIHSPKIIGTPSEGGAEVFTVDYFGRKAFLAQSPQFYKQMAMSAGFEKVFESGPVFRADRSHTVRHLAEFTGFDVEISFIESEEELMRFEEEMLTHAIAKVKEKHGTEIQKLFGFEIKVPLVPFPRLSMGECSKVLKEVGVIEEGDLSSEGEKKIGEIIKEKYSHEFVFVTGYKYSKRPFYHMKTKEEGTKSFELLYSGMEITTGAQREHRYEVLKEQAIGKGLSLEPLADYLSFFKYGCPPHGGFGIGTSRILMQLLHLGTIREAVLLTRTEERLTP
jgi:aspartyl-tRNA synthetase